MKIRLSVVISIAILWVGNFIFGSASQKKSGLEEVFNVAGHQELPYHVEESGPLSFQTIDNLVNDDDLDTLQKLIKQGRLDINGTYGPRGEPLIVIAAKNKSADIVQFLINAGAKVDAMDQNKNTALLSTMRYYKKAQDKTNLLSTEEMEKLDTAIKQATRLHKDLSEIISDYAQRNPGLEIVFQLLKAGANPVHYNNDEESVLEYATSMSNEPVVKLLLEDPRVRKDINHQNDIDGDTALHKALYYPIFKLLIEAGANPNIKNEEGKTAYAEIGTTELIEAARANDEEEVARILNTLSIAKKSQKQDYINVINKSYESALSVTEDLDIARMLVKAGFDVNRRNQLGETALHVIHDRKFINRLAQSGADLNAQNNEGKTPLMKAAECGCSGSIGVVQELIRLGANPMIRDKSGKTVFDILRAINTDSARKMLKIIQEGAAKQEKEKKSAESDEDIDLSDIYEKETHMPEVD